MVCKNPYAVRGEPAAEVMLTCSSQTLGELGWVKGGGRGQAVRYTVNRGDARTQR